MARCFCRMIFFTAGFIPENPQSCSNTKMESGMAVSKKTVSIGFIIIALVGAGAYFLWQHIKPQDNDVLKLYGNVDIRQVDLAFRVPGRIAEVLVDEGDKVEAGQPSRGWIPIC